MTVDGGFSGRANKLVDSCYNFWQGGSFPIIQNLLDPVYKDKNHWICDEKSLHGKLIALEVLYVTNLYDSSDLYTVAKSYLLSNAGLTPIFRIIIPN